MNTTQTYKWATWGDLNAFWALMLDNVTNLVLFTSILAGVFGFPLDFIFTKMIPGTCLGVMIGDVVYSWLAIKLARETGNNNVTAMPLGLDTPSTIGMAFAVLGPAYLATGKNAELTWYIGMSVMVFMGLFKLLFSFIGGWVQRVVPQAGLLGSLAGIGIALLGFLPLVDIFKMPIVGLVALGIVLCSVVAKLPMPKGVPGIFAAVAIGTVIYYATGPAGLLGLAHFKAPQLSMHLSLPLPSLGFIYGFKDAIPYLPIALPFGLLTVVGGINVTESARLAGDHYNTRTVLLTEAIATLVAGIFGGMAQSTPYIGHPAYKAMGARAAYTLATGIFIGLGGILGYTSSVVDLIPAPAVAGILIFVGLEIVSQAYEVCPHRHFAAVGLACLPTVANLAMIQVDNLQGQMMGALHQLPGVSAILKAHPLHLPHEMETSLQAIHILGHGFILTGMLWGAFLAFLIDREMAKAILVLGVTALLTLFGVIHSVLPSGSIYLPWQTGSAMPYYLTLAYLLIAGWVWFLSKTLPKEGLQPLTDS